MIEWKINGIFKADANAVYKEITSIGESCTLQQIVDKARDQATELHKCFEWNDSVAAEKYRVEQARHVVTMLAISAKPTEENPKLIMVRAIVSQNNGNNEYQTIQATVRNEDSYQKLLRTALDELAAFKNKYSVLSELESVIEEIEKTLSTA